MADFRFRITSVGGAFWVRMGWLRQQILSFAAQLSSVAAPLVEICGKRFAANNGILSFSAVVLSIIEI